MSSLIPSDVAFRFFQDLAEDLSRGNLVFPTFLQPSAGLKEALIRQEWSNAELATLVSSEPLLSARVVALANSAALNASGKSVYNVKMACMKVGHKAVRSLAATLLVEQAARADEMLPFTQFARQVWEHSLQVAVMAYVLARATRRWVADEGMFAGLVHDMGHFYIYWRAARFDVLVANPEQIQSLAHEWHCAVGNQLVLKLGLPEEIATACDQHEIEHNLLQNDTLSELISFANRCAHPERDREMDKDVPEDSGGRLTIAEARAVLSDARAEVSELIGTLRGAAQVA